MHTPSSSRHWIAFVFASAIALPFATREAAAQRADEACDAFDVDYQLAASLQLTDTPMGKGDGVYSIGPGAVTLRLDAHPTGPSTHVDMRAYSMQETFAITSTALFWTTHVLTDTRTAATPNACVVAAEGELVGRTLRWKTPVSGYHTDGTITCDGSLCGTFGAPPAGRSELHIPPHPVAFRTFDFAADMKTFSMSSTFVSKTDSPKQTAHVSLAGREVRRVCVRAPKCS